MKLPDYKEKQRILYIAAKPAKDLIAFGDAYLADNRVSDAIDCYQKAGYAEGMEKIKALAREDGDVMIYQQILKALNRTASADEWDDIGRRALDKKKFAFAMAAFEKSGNAAMYDQVKSAKSKELTTN